eukprot:106209_1
MGVCMAPEVRREIKQIEDIYHKTCELKQCKRVLVVGATGSGKSELIHQALSTNDAHCINQDLQFEYQMGPFTVCEKAQPEYSLRAWEHRHDIISWDNTLSYYPPVHEDSTSSMSSSYDSFFHDQFDFDLLITGYARIHGGIDMIDFAPRIQTIMNSYYPRPSITCSKHEIIDENMVEFWELSSFDHAFWSFCAKQIVGIAFVVDLSCFDEFHYDSATYTKKQNKMSQTLANFRQMIQHKAVTNCNNTAFFVILNKTDAFKEKLSRGTSIKICPEFQGYEGADFDYNQCIAHIKDVFDEMNNASERLVYFHETCAVAKTGSDLNGLGVIPEDSSSDKIQKIWHKFGVNLNYHWNLLHS